MGYFGLLYIKYKEIPIFVCFAVKLVTMNRPATTDQLDPSLCLIHNSCFILLALQGMISSIQSTIPDHHHHHPPMRSYNHQSNNSDGSQQWGSRRPLNEVTCFKVRVSPYNKLLLIEELASIISVFITRPICLNKQ